MLSISFTAANTKGLIAIYVAAFGLSKKQKIEGKIPHIPAFGLQSITFSLLQEGQMSKIARPHLNLSQATLK